MARKHIRPVFLRRWFPSNDPIAAVVARLVILREDYIMELQGMVTHGFNPFDETATEKGFGSLDANSSEWRRLYFYRNSLRSLREIRNAMDILYTNDECKAALAKCSKDIQDAFERLKKELETTKGLVKELRDNIGAHILHKGVRKALDNMGIDRRGMFEIGQTTGEIHYKFASELVLSIMIPGVRKPSSGTS